jgi:hypothetical protein
MRVPSRWLPRSCRQNTEHVLQITSRRLGQYCKPIDPEFMARLARRKPTRLEALNRAWYGYRNTSPERRGGSRYHGLSLNSLFYRKTIEFRYFNGSVDADEVKAYVQLVLALAANALSAKAGLQQAPRVQPRDREVRLPRRPSEARADRRRVQDGAPVPDQASRRIGRLEARSPRADSGSRKRSRQRRHRCRSCGGMNPPLRLETTGLHAQERINGTSNVLRVWL